MRQHTTKRNGGSDQCIQLLISPDRELQMAWRDTLDFEIFGCVTREFENFGRQVLEDGGNVDGG
jgi:hypothetical protein